MINNRPLLLFIFLTFFANTLYAQNFKKDLTYEKYTLDDEYFYQKEPREFQWEQIDSLLTHLEGFLGKHQRFGYIQNYKNRKGNAPLVAGAKKNRRGNYVDAYQIERYQSVPLYRNEDDTLKLIRYGQDGSLITILGDSAEHYVVQLADMDDEIWYVPERYVQPVETTHFDQTIFVDRRNQNITMMRFEDNEWVVKSMNPATTGLATRIGGRPTPLGSFVVMQKRPRMYYYKAGTSVIGGFAPYASRFCRGGYIHGVPVNLPRKTTIEYSPSLGTTPRSQMCVRNATSHAKFIYDQVEKYNTLVFVIE